MPRTTQEVIASFPAAIVVDLRGMHCDAPFGIVKPGEIGYHPLYVAEHLYPDRLDEIVMRKNNCRKPTDAERRAAINGSMWGWDIPGADPENEFNAKD